MCAELAREEKDQPFRSGAITPDGFIEEDFEEELGSPNQVINHVKALDVLSLFCAHCLG